jgi:hypothetical protein
VVRSFGGEELTQANTSIFALKLIAVIRSLAKTVKVLFPCLPLPVYRHETLLQTGLAQTTAWSKVGVPVLYLPGLSAFDTKIGSHPLHPLTDPCKLFIAKCMPKMAPFYPEVVLICLNRHGAVLDLKTPDFTGIALFCTAQSGRPGCLYQGCFTSTNRLFL